MNVKGEVVVRLSSEAEARAVLAAIAPENGAFVRARLDGATLHAEAEAATPGALLHTLDDLLACIAVAQKAAVAARDP